ncbi:MAG TPA: MBL fold metallo-hydrolase [Pseudonocardiaceae bacterium]|nr:MBL fold metallo-hydrolase [Pseudonocardiaceae bacterium]
MTAVKLPFGRPSLLPYRTYIQRSVVTPGGLTTRFLGTSSVVFSDGDTTLLGDGFVTRPGLARVLLGRIGPDRSRVRAAIERSAAQSLDAVFCAHSHYDHALDAPVWCLETGADLVGSESTANIGRGLGVPESTLKVIGHGDVLRYGRFELTFLESVHSHGDRFPGTVDRPLVPPAKAGEWKTGTAYSVLINHPAGTILWHASANYVPGMLAGRKADVIYLGIGGIGRQPPEFARDYWAETVAATGARRIILVHWDDFFTSLDRPLRMSPNFFDDLDTAMDRLLPLARRNGIDVMLPAAWVPADPFA